jgi:hypothetical protein
MSENKNILWSNLTLKKLTIKHKLLTVLGTEFLFKSDRNMWVMF